MFDISKFPVDRDIYTLSEIARFLYDIPMAEVQRWDQNSAINDLKEAGVHYKMFGGAQKTWPGGTLCTLYCIRNLEKYRLSEIDPVTGSKHRMWDHWNGDDWVKVADHLRKYDPPEPTGLSKKQRTTRKERIEEAIRRAEARKKARDWVEKTTNNA